MEFQDPAQILRPCFPCKFCNQEYFYSQASLCEHEINDHGYVRPTTVTTPKIAPTFGESSGEQGGCENWYSVAETGNAEPYWAQWTKENEGCLREYVLNIRTSRSIHLQDAGLPFLDFVPDYSASNFPKSLFTKLNTHRSHLNAEEADTSSIATPTNDLPSALIYMASEDCNSVSVEVDSSANPGVADSEYDVGNVEMDIDSEIMTYCEAPLNEELCLTDAITDSIDFQHDNPIQGRVSNPETLVGSMSTSNCENEILLVSSTQDQMPLSFATQEQILTEKLICDTSSTEIVTSSDQIQINCIDSPSSQDTRIIQPPKEGIAPPEEILSSICTSSDKIHSGNSLLHKEHVNNSGNELNLQETLPLCVSRNNPLRSTIGTNSPVRTEIRTDVEPSSHPLELDSSGLLKASTSNIIREPIGMSTTSSLVNRSSNCKSPKSKSPKSKSPKSKSPSSKRLLPRRTTRQEQIGRTRSQTQKLSPKKLTFSSTQIVNTKRL